MYISALPLGAAASAMGDPDHLERLLQVVALVVAASLAQREEGYAVQGAYGEEVIAVVLAELPVFVGGAEFEG